MAEPKERLGTEQNRVNTLLLSKLRTVYLSLVHISAKSKMEQRVGHTPESSRMQYTLP